jgi:hypothetical protein
MSCDASFSVLECGQEEERLILDGFKEKIALLEGAFEGLGDDEFWNLEQLDGGIAELIDREGAVASMGGFEEDMVKTGDRAEERIVGDTKILGDLIRGLKPDTGDVAGKDIRIGANAIDGFIAVGFVNADRAAGADAMGMEEDHDGADDLLFSPGVFDLFPAFWAYAFDLFEACGGMFDDVEDGIAELLHEFAGIDGTDAFNHATAEILFDAFTRGGWCAGQEQRLELESVIAIANPASLGVDPFAGADAGERADDGDEIAVTFDFELEDGESRVFVEERDPFNQSGQALGWCRGGGVWIELHTTAVMGMR